MGHGPELGSVIGADLVAFLAPPGIKHFERAARSGERERTPISRAIIAILGPAADEIGPHQKKCKGTSMLSDI
jgi:hypothetical protein